MHPNKYTFFLSAILLVAFWSCSNEVEPTTSNSSTATKAAKKVETIKVKAIDYSETIFASGKLASSEESRLSFKTGGIIKKILVAEGQQVRRGQLLAELDLQEINAQVQQADLGREQSDIQVKNAALALQLAERDYRNTKGLYEDSVATLEQLENVEVQLDNAKNQLEAAKKGLDFSAKNLDVAQFNYKYSKINAPANGTILMKLAEVNELVGPGNPVFLFGSKDKSLVLRVNITDKDIIHVQLGNKAEVVFDAYPNSAFEGTVRQIASMADPFTNTYEVEVEIDPAGKRLLSGFIGMVNIKTNTARNLVEVPIDALISANQNEGEVFVVENGKAIKTQIGIHKIEAENLLVYKGLSNDAEVIISGVGYLEHEEAVLIGQK